MLIAMPSLISTLVNAAPVNCEPWSVLKISGLPCVASGSSNVSTQNAAFIVIETRHDRTRRLNQSSTTAIGLGLAACQKGLSVGFNTAAAFVHELLEARDEKRLLRLQRQLAGYMLLIIDELGYVPLSQTGAELLFVDDNEPFVRTVLWRTVANTHSMGFVVHK
jgi:hypothetical protein